MAAARRRWHRVPMSSFAFSYVESDVPTGMTLSAWRAAEPRRKPQRRLRMPRLPRLAPGLTPHPAG
jgi:hypothetical protein